MYDFIVVGGGPSGAAFARLAGKKHKILIIEKRKCAGTDKSCGGLLAPDAQKILAESGLGVPKSILCEPQVFAVKALDLDRKYERYYQKSYINIDRGQFDWWLLSLVPDRTDIVCGATFKTARKIKNGYEVTYLKDGELHQAETCYLVGADGGNSKVRKLISGAATISRFFSIQEWFDTETLPDDAYPTHHSHHPHYPYYWAVFSRKITPFYCWLIPKDQQFILGGAFSERPREKFELLKKELSEYISFRSFRRRQGAVICRPRNQREIVTCANGIFLLGEAAGFISPSSAEGISFALRSAQFLHQSSGGNIHVSYRRACRTLRAAVFMKHCKIPFMFHPFLRGLIIKSGFRALDMK